jgi:deoxyribodipyrimidine photolyase
MVDRSSIIVWFRDDLRLSDHPALSTAAKTGAPVLALTRSRSRRRPVERWASELSQLPAKLIHQPGRASPIELKSANVELGRTYLEPIVDHGKGRERALAVTPACASIELASAALTVF